MTRTTILLDSDLWLRLKQLAGAKGMTMTAIIRDAITAYLERHQKTRKLSIIGIGSSGKGNLSEDAEKILKQRFRNRKGR
jgi:predicted transcriptional regulator